jgi:hypothetical protein
MSVTSQVEDHRTRCLVPLISLRMLARGEAGEPMPRWAVVEVSQATRTVLAEAEAASRDATACDASAGHPGGRGFLQVRLDRLAAAADAALVAARVGDAARMIRQLRRFDVLTAAFWDVEDAVYGMQPVPARS